MLIERSDVGMISTSVALLFARFGSKVAAGADTDAVFERETEAEFDTEPLVVAKVTLPPTGILTVRLMLPLLGDEPPQVAPPAATQVQLIVPLRPDTEEKLSVTTAPVTGSGPALLTTIV